MFEDKSFENILNEMLGHVPGGLDKREGSMIYNAVAPAAYGLKNMYIALDLILKETFADTATREYLILRAYERGITPQSATRAVMSASFNMDVPIGSRFSASTFRYTTLSKIDDFNFELECETAGADANYQLGRLVPIEYISGLTDASLTSVIMPGQDVEDTSCIRNRYIQTLNGEAFGGNISDYSLKVNAIDGVGGVRVIPVWNGGGTVKLIIIDSDYNVPSTTLVDDVQAEIDPVSGTGEGIAPIGHMVTVEAASGDLIDISMTITYEPGWTFGDIAAYLDSVIDAYFIELMQTWEEGQQSVVRISQIETRVLDLDGVVDIYDTLINGQASNYVTDDIPKRGEISG